MAELLTFSNQIIEVVRRIKGCVDKVSLNKELCANIANRCEAMYPALENLQKRESQQGIPKELDELLQRLLSVVKAVESHVEKFNIDNCGLS